MNIVHITSEFSPFAKAGGLADVLHGLSKQQVDSGHSVSVILPKYDIIDIKVFDSIEIHTKDLWSYEDGIEFHNTVYKAVFENITIFLIEPHHNSYYFNRGLIYGAINDTERFLYFCRAAVGFLIDEGKAIDILHLHDWPTAAVAPLIHHLAPKLKKKIGSIIYSIHNIQHQGSIAPKHLTRIGLLGESFLPKDEMQDPHSPLLINLMKGAIKYSDKVITVSPTYAKEIQTSRYGYGLQTVMQQLGNKLHGILNGIETNTWDPSIDTFLHTNYPSNSTYIHDISIKKGINKKALFKELNMDENAGGPFVVCVTRIAEQKSPELILRALYQTVAKGGSFALLGTICDPALEKKFQSAKEHFKKHKNCYIGYHFNDALSHKLFAAADAIFIPSKFEPCGLTQIIAMKYATIPIARNTGGLKDTVTDIKEKGATGFIFEDLTEAAVDDVLDKAFNIFINHHDTWKTLMQNGLNRDASWLSPSAIYDRTYKEALTSKTKDSVSKKLERKEC